MKALLDGDLSSPRGIEQCSEAAMRLQHCTAAEIHPCKYPGVIPFTFTLVKLARFQSVTCGF